MTNGWEVPVLIFASIRLGSVACPLSTRLPAEGLRRELDEVGARHLIRFRRERRLLRLTQ